MKTVAKIVLAIVLIPGSVLAFGFLAWVVTVAKAWVGITFADLCQKLF